MSRHPIVKGLMVTLKNDMHEEDVQALINAIKLMRDVYSVEAVNTFENIDDMMNRARIEGSLRGRLYKLIDEDWSKDDE